MSNKKTLLIIVLIFCFSKPVLAGQNASYYKEKYNICVKYVTFSNNINAETEEEYIKSLPGDKAKKLKQELRTLNLKYKFKKIVKSSGSIISGTFYITGKILNTFGECIAEYPIYLPETEEKIISPSLDNNLTNNYSTSFGNYEKIYANNGTYLGTNNPNQFDSQSIYNRFGQYGSQFSSQSINNSMGIYGSQYSSTSPNNPYTQNGKAVNVNSGQVRSYGSNPYNY